MGTHPIFESDFDCLTECWAKKPMKAGSCSHGNSVANRSAEFEVSDTKKIYNWLRHEEDFDDDSIIQKVFPWWVDREILDEAWSRAKTSLKKQSTDGISTIEFDVFEKTARSLTSKNPDNMTYDTAEVFNETAECLKKEDNTITKNTPSEIKITMIHDKIVNNFHEQFENTEAST